LVYLQLSGADLVSVESGDREHRLVVVGHRHEAETFALVRRQISHHLRAAQAAPITRLSSAVKVKVKFSHTRYRALGPELIPVYRQSARR